MGRMTEEAKKHEELAVRGQANTPTGILLERFEKAWPRMAAAASNAVSRDRMYQLIVSTINRNPKLAECTPESVLSCFMRCTALGLEPSDVDGLGRAYILPFRNGKTNRMDATFIIGYKGLIDLARRSGKIRDISSRAVYDGDTFEYEYGLNETLRHIPGPGEKLPDKLTHVYCVVHFTDGGHYIDVMTKAEVDAVRKRSKSSKYGPWVTDYEAMAKKSVIRRAAPYLPLSTQAYQAVAADDTDGGYMEALTLAPVIEETNAGGEGPVSVMEDHGETSREQEYSDTSSAVGTAFVACATCGNMREVSPGLRKDELDVFLCCDEPNYSYV